MKFRFENLDSKNSTEYSYYNNTKGQANDNIAKKM